MAYLHTLFPCRNHIRDLLMVFNGTNTSAQTNYSGSIFLLPPDGRRTLLVAGRWFKLILQPPEVAQRQPLGARERFGSTSGRRKITKRNLRQMAKGIFMLPANDPGESSGPWEMAKGNCQWPEDWLQKYSILARLSTTYVAMRLQTTATCAFIWSCSYERTQIRKRHDNIM